jgi:beta-lactamase class C
MRLIRFLCALCLVPLPAAAAPGNVHGLSAAFDERFRALLAEENIPGGAYAVVHRGVPVRVGVAGTTDIRTGEAVNPDTVFRIASVSKGFAATLAALLAGEGRFSWAEPITRYVPSFEFQGVRESVKIHDVVGQSSGFIPHAYDNLIEAGIPRNEVWQRFASLSPICAPGTCYTYQNSVFSLIEPVLEQASQSSYPELVRERIFQPLGMHNASAGFEGYRDSNNHAVPHVKRARTWRAVSVEPDYYSVSSAAGINASVLDMAEWLIAALGHRPEVITVAALDQVMTPRVRTVRELRRKHWREYLNDAHYGLGWRIYEFGDEELVYHGGWVSGFRAEIALSRRHDLGLVILMNGESSAIAELSSGFWSRAFESFDTPTITAGAGAVAASSAR